MNPPLSAPVVAPEEAVRPRDSRGVRAFGVALFVGGLTAGAVLVATGAPLPPWGPLLVLAVALALSINRYTFFPSELAVTAEAAVIFAAVVAFATDASLLGAWCVALLVGPLDALHWQQRAFTRMAHNAGDRMLAALAAAGAFQLVAPGGEGSALTIASGVLAAVIAFGAVEVVLSTVLLRLHHVATGRAALWHALQLEVLTPALAVAGTAAGLLAGPVGWWCTLLVLVPLPVLSEWALARVRRPSTRRGAVALSVLAVTAAALLPAARVGGPAACAAVLGVGLAALAGVELAPSTRAVPCGLGVVVVLPAIVVDGGGAVITVVAAALAGTLASWATRDGDVTLLRVVVVAAPAAALAALVVHFDGAVAALAAMAVFEFTTALCGPGGRVTSLRALPWVTPLATAVVAVGLLPRATGISPLAAPGGAVVLFAVVVWWGLPPWPSRVLGRAAARSRHSGRRVLLALVTALAVALMVVGHTTRDRRWMELGALVTTEFSLVLASVAARQWLFAPRGRHAASWLVALAALGALVVLTSQTPVGVQRVVVASTVSAAFGLGFRPARLGDVSAGSTPKQRASSRPRSTR